MTETSLLPLAVEAAGLDLGGCTAASSTPLSPALACA